MNEIEKLTDLEGLRLSYVCFVMDYVQFGFGDSIVTAYADPIAEIDNRQRKFPETESRDALCLLIDHPLVKVTVEAGLLATFMFDTGKIKIPLDDRSRVNGDGVEFLPGRGKPIQHY